MITILFIGDIVGRPGRRAVRELLPELTSEIEAGCVIANAENAAGGSGVTPDVAEELLDYGIDVLTSGDHIWKNRAVYDIIMREPRLLRPANYPPDAPGRGSLTIACRGGGRIGVVNVLGRVFMNPADCPFAAAAREIDAVRRETPLVVVDFHAEATSEKIAMGRYLDGRVSAVVGTHTHVPTADERIFPGGTAYITDVGMTGPSDSILGREIMPVVQHFISRLPQRFGVAKGTVEFQGVLVRADEESGRALEIRRLKRTIG